MPWPNRMLLGNTLLRWVIAFAVAGGLTMLGRLVRDGLAPRLARRALRTGQLLDICLANLVSHTHSGFLLVLVIPIAAQFLDIPPRPEHYLALLVPVALLVQSAAWAHWGIGLWVERRFQGHGDPATDGTRASRAAVLGFLVRLTLWSLVLLLILDIVGFNITTLLASLGIGGIAVALAVQNVLSDLFASLSITLDQPFVIGDFIIVDQVLGTVQYIGLKSTRIRSLSGEQIIISNGDLLKSRIRNYKKMVERRVAFDVSISERTPEPLAAAVSGWIQQIIETLPGVRFDRAHLREFSASGLTYEVVYYVLDSDHKVYMDKQEAINLGMLRRFRQEGVALSFPIRILRDQRPAVEPGEPSEPRRHPIQRASSRREKHEQPHPES